MHIHFKLEITLQNMEGCSFISKAVSNFNIFVADLGEDVRHKYHKQHLGACGGGYISTLKSISLLDKIQLAYL